MNILDYVDFRGDITFCERPFNEVDNLIFSELSYVEMDDFISPDGETSMTLRELREAYLNIKDRFDYAFSDPWPLLDRCGRSDRFGDVRVKFFVKKYDYEKQFRFTAVTFIFEEKTAYVAFRGTDGNIDGWRECFNLSYLTETAGQKEALDYLEMVSDALDPDLIVGGHSKGGNFAVYAASFAREDIRRGRIKAIYSNDGPGFGDNVVDSEGYREILGKTLKITPEASIVGGLLKSLETVKVIKGDGAGPIQHDPFNWRVIGTEFEPSDRKPSADLTVEALSIWIDGMDEDERREFTEAVFEVLYDTGMTDFSDIHKKKLKTAIALTKAQRKMDPEKKKTVKDGLSKLRKAAGIARRSKGKKRQQ